MTALVTRAALAALAVLLLAVGGDAADGYGVAGPYRVLIDRIDACAPDQTDVPFRAYIKMVRDRHRLSLWHVSGNLTAHHTLDDDNSGLLRFESWGSGGGWKANAVKLEMPALCTMLKRMVPDLWHRVRASAFGDPNRECPIPPGTYSIHNVSTELDKELRGMPAFFYGKYRAFAYMVHTKSRRRFVCVMYTVRIVPKYVQSR